MLLLNSIRGAHSTGVFGVNKDMDDNNPHIVKSVGSPYSLYDYNKSDEFFQKMVSHYGFVVGHGRFSTMGTIDANNAHPFKEGHITLAHNGVIRNYQQLKDYRRHKHIEVDSHLICKLFEEEGAMEVLPTIQGAYTFIWWDANEGTLNFVKNDERPLLWAEYKNKPILSFASEEGTLIWNSIRNKIPLKEMLTLPNHTIFSFKKNSLEYTTKSYKPKIIYGGSRNAPLWDELEERIYTGNFGNNVSSIQKPTNFKQKRKKQSPSSVTEADAFILNNTLITNGLSIGDIIEFDIVDYEVKHDQHMLIWGGNNNHPCVEFYSVKTNVSSDAEKEVIYSDGLRGCISSIQRVPSESTFNGATWRVFVTNFVHIFRKQGEDSTIPNGKPLERVLLSDIYKENYVFTNLELLQMADAGCGWCDKPIPHSDLKDLTALRCWNEAKDPDNDPPVHRLLGLCCKESYDEIPTKTVH